MEESKRREPETTRHELELPAWIARLQRGLCAFSVERHAECGTVLFNLRNTRGEIERAAIQITENRIEVLPNGRLLPTLPATLIHGSVSDWEAFVSNPSASSLDAFRFYGHLPLLSIFEGSKRDSRGMLGLRSLLTKSTRRDSVRDRVPNETRR